MMHRNLVSRVFALAIVCLCLFTLPLGAEPQGGGLPQSYLLPADIAVKLEKLPVTQSGYRITVKGELECLIGKPTQVELWLGSTPNLSHEEPPRSFEVLSQGQKRDFLFSLKGHPQGETTLRTRIWLWVKYVPDYDALIRNILQNKKQYSDKFLRAQLLTVLKEGRKIQRPVHTGVSIYPEEEESLARVLNDRNLGN